MFGAREEVQHRDFQIATPDLFKNFKIDIWYKAVARPSTSLRPRRLSTFRQSEKCNLPGPELAQRPVTDKTAQGIPCSGNKSIPSANLSGVNAAPTAMRTKKRETSDVTRQEVHETNQSETGARTSSATGHRWPGDGRADLIGGPACGLFQNDARQHLPFNRARQTSAGTFFPAIG